jgi:hypothetical protein
MNDASHSQTAGRAKTRQPGLLVKPPQIVLSSYYRRNQSPGGVVGSGPPWRDGLGQSCAVYQSQLYAQERCEPLLDRTFLNDPDYPTAMTRTRIQQMNHPSIPEFQHARIPIIAGTASFRLTKKPRTPAPGAKPGPAWDWSCANSSSSSTVAVSGWKVSRGGARRCFSRCRSVIERRTLFSICPCPPPNPPLKNPGPRHIPQTVRCRQALEEGWVDGREVCRNAEPDPARGGRRHALMNPFSMIPGPYCRPSF